MCTSTCTPLRRTEYCQHSHTPVPPKHTNNSFTDARYAQCGSRQGVRVLLERAAPAKLACALQTSEMIAYACKDLELGGATCQTLLV